MFVASYELPDISIRMRYILLLVLLLFAVPFAVDALEITELHVKPIKRGEHVALRLSAKTRYNLFIPEELPPRLVLDLPLAHWRKGVGLPKNYKDPMISSIRFSRHDAKTSRVVFDFVANIRAVNSGLIHKKHTYWLEFDIIKQVGGHKSVSDEKSTNPVITKPVIVIDAGHGGQDAGTAGFSGSKEKNLTLRYAQALKEALLETERYQVFLTRNDDHYLLLGERVKRAREAKGNLFISIHADSSPVSSARGLSVYTISEKASDKQSEALAEKENKADIIGGMDLSDTSKDVADILIDLTQRETLAKSNKFADILVKKFRHEVNLLNHTHRSAGFAVLKAPDIPSVLIEIGFLTNQKEEKLLETDAYQEKFMRGITCAIDNYFSNR